MPTKRIIILSKRPDSQFYRYVLWADVPAGNQLAYRNQSATSAYEQINPIELGAIRSGAVVEKVDQLATDLTAITSIQSLLEVEWSQWQAKVTAEALWSDYGRFWDGATWTASPGVPMFSVRETLEGPPTFIAITPVSAFGANKFHLVLFNAAPPLSQSLVAKIRLVAIRPGQATVVGVAPSDWMLQRRSGPGITNPSGGILTSARTDTAMNNPPAIQLFNAPTISPSGGTVEVFNQFVPQADEQKVSTADAPTLAAALSYWGGQVVYSSNEIGQTRPITIRSGEMLEVVQSAIAGLGNAQVLCVFTVG